AEAGGMRWDDEIPLIVYVGVTGEDPPPEYGDLVIEALDPHQAAVHAEVAAAGFEAPMEEFLRLTTPAVLGRPGVRAYVGTIDGEPVATSVGVCLESHVGIFNVATVPTHRRRGYGARAHRSSCPRWRRSRSAVGVVAIKSRRPPDLREAWLQDPGIVAMLGRDMSPPPRLRS